VDVVPATQRVRVVRRRDVVGVGGVGLVVPAQAQVERQAVVDLPVILQVNAELLARGGQAAAAVPAQRRAKPHLVGHGDILADVVVVLGVVGVLFQRRDVD